MFPALSYRAPSLQPPCLLAGLSGTYVTLLDRWQTRINERNSITVRKESYEKRIKESEGRKKETGNVRIT